MPLVGDAGTTFGSGDGTITAHSFAFNDTHTFNSSWLNEIRVGYSMIKFNMTSIGYGENYSEQMGIPGANINEVSSAFTQINFEQGGSRNLGGNGNQPLITNLGAFQLYDNVSYLKGRHTFKAGASVIFRTREVLNADNMMGQFAFSQNQTSNCAGVASGCAVNANTGLDFASFLLGTARRKFRAMTSEDTYMERRPEWAALHPGRLPRDQQAHAQPGPALGHVRSLGGRRRPAVELRPRDGADGRRLRGRRHQRRQRRTAPADLVEERLRPAARASPTT